MCGEPRATNGGTVKQTLYMKYGSRVTSGMAEYLYDRMLDDPELATFFDGVDIDWLREHVADFLSVLAGAPKSIAAAIFARHMPTPESRSRISRW